MTVIDGEVFLSTTEVAMRFSVTPRTILRWQEKNPKVLAAVKGLNGRLYFHQASVDQAIKKVYFKDLTPAKIPARSGARTTPAQLGG